MVLTVEEFADQLQRDIERWKAEAAKASIGFPGLAAEIGKWIEAGEDLLDKLRKSHA